MVPREWRVEVEAEVETWLSGLAAADFRVTARVIDLLGEQGADLRMPRSRNLGSGLKSCALTAEAGRGPSLTGSTRSGGSRC